MEIGADCRGCLTRYLLMEGFKNDFLLIYYGKGMTWAMITLKERAPDKMDGSLIMGTVNGTNIRSVNNGYDRSIEIAIYSVDGG